MAKHTGEHFENKDVVLDGNEFVDCTFKNVALVYSGGQIPAIQNCNFEAFALRFDGPARNTLEFLRGLSGPQSGFRPVVEATFKTILER